MSITIYDIAEKAEVSIATVSRAFNNHPRVSPKTRQRIFQIAEQCNYRPNVSARSLARQNTYAIAAIIPMMANYFFLEVIRGLQDRLAESEFDLMLYPVLTPNQGIEHLERAMQRGRCEGVMLFSTWIDNEQAEWIKSFKQQLILVDSHHEAFDSISVDNKRGGYLATRHLIECGYRQIGLLCANLESTPAVLRKTGYQQALLEADFPIDARLIYESQDARTHGFSEEAGYEDMKRLLAQAPNLEAVFATSDVQALGALRALRERGFQAPNNIGIIGFDDVKFAGFAGLSTIHQPMYNLGCMAVDHFFRRMHDPSLPISHLTLLPELIIRETTGGIKQPSDLILSLS